MCVDMGLLQMEVEGRPDGERPHGYETYFDYLLSLVLHDGVELRLFDEQCMEIDRICPSLPPSCVLVAAAAIPSGGRDAEHRSR